MWEELYDSLDVVLGPGGRRPAPPDDAALDAFEREAGRPLPASYRAFVRVFGAGEVGGFFSIRAPGYPPDTDADLAEFDRRMHADDEDEARLCRQPVETFRRKFHFASVNGGELVAWDWSDVRCERPREYGIYLRTRDSKFLELAGSFESFILDIVLRTGLDPAWERAGYVVEDPWPVHRVFVPVSR